MTSTVSARAAGQRPPVAEREQPDDDHADQQRQQHGAGVELGDERSGHRVLLEGWCSDPSSLPGAGRPHIGPEAPTGGRRAGPGSYAGGQDATSAASGSSACSWAQADAASIR